MLISTIKLKGVEHKLKYPIEVDERESWLGGKHMYVFEIRWMGLLSYHNNIEISRMCIEELVNSIINTRLFEDYSDPKMRKPLEFQTKLKRYVYG